MSLGGSGTDDVSCGDTNNDAMHKAICRSVSAGITYVVAAGNDSADAATSTTATYDEAITVSALADFNGLPGGGAPSTCRADVDDTFANFSNWGADVNIIAPGRCINSTWMLGGYNTISGTSMASPHVAGAAALYKATHPHGDPASRQGGPAERRLARLEQRRRPRQHHGATARRDDVLTRHAHRPTPPRH